MKDIWEDYSPGNLVQRNAIIEYHHELVEKVATKLARRLPKSVSLSDLIGYGYFGLIDAVDKFEPDRGFKFETYAARRIHGSILDGLRSADWVPRSVRSRAKEIEKATLKLESDLGRHATNLEIAEEIGQDEEFVRVAKRDVETGMVSSMDVTSPAGDDDNVGYGAFLAAPGDASQSIELDGIIENLLMAIESMEDRERIVMHLVYWEDLSMADIGIILGVTESRVCQILTKANIHIKSKLDVRVS